LSGDKKEREVSIAAGGKDDSAEKKSRNYSRKVKGKTPDRERTVNGRDCRTGTIGKKEKG